MAYHRFHWFGLYGLTLASYGVSQVSLVWLLWFDSDCIWRIMCFIGLVSMV